MTLVAIDGPAGAGKSTVARRVAATLGVPYLDTGAMYRAVAWRALELGLDPGNSPAMEELTRRLDLELRVTGNRVEVLVDGVAPGEELRTPEVDAATSRLATHRSVRSWLVDKQREFAAREGAVVEGRDIGTVVFPDARHKFYLDAPLDVRAERRFKQFGVANGRERARLIREIRDRDDRDRRRASSPLRHDVSHQLIDTSTADAGEIVSRILASVRGGADDGS